jgi:hypothetical protein
MRHGRLLRRRIRVMLLSVLTVAVSTVAVGIEPVVAAKH